MSIEGRPALTSSGQLARTPLPHLLVYAHDRQLSGTFHFRAPDATTAHVLLVKGRPAKVRLSSPQIYLGQVLLECGAIDAQTLDASLRDMAASRKLHGIVLLERGAIDRARTRARAASPAAPEDGADRAHARGDGLRVLCGLGRARRFRRGAHADRYVRGDVGVDPRAAALRAREGRARADDARSHSRREEPRSGSASGSRARSGGGSISCALVRCASTISSTPRIKSTNASRG